MILTSYWFTKLPADLIKIGISRGTPKAMIGKVPTMPELAPGTWFKTASDEDYRRLYLAILDKLDPYEVVAKIDRLAQGRIPVLVCWEQNNGVDWCHRGYLANWITANTGVVVEELQSPGLHLKQHPMIPAQFREAPPAPPKPAGRLRPHRKAA